MKSYIISIYFLFFCFYLSAQNPQAWMEKHTISIHSLNSEDFTDLEFLKEELKGKRIVQLGESSHGIGDYYSLKSRLVKFLHQEMGFEVLAIEGGFGEINLANVDKNKLSAKALMQNTLFGNFQNEEMLQAFEYLKKVSKGPIPLELAGFDCQSSSSYFQKFMQRLLAVYDSSLAREFEEDFSSSFDLYQHTKDSSQIMPRLASNKKLFQKIRRLIQSKEVKIRSLYPNHPQLIEIILQNLKSYEAYWDFSFQELAQFKNSSFRDELMAQNLIWLTEHLYPDKKIILWAHNAHIHKGEASWTNPDGIRPRLQGELLHQYFGEENYVLGLFSIRGESYQHWTQSYITFDHSDKKHLAEYQFKDLPGNIHFLPLTKLTPDSAPSWLFKATQVFQVETGGEFAIDPLTDIYDSIIVIDKVHRPRYYK